MRRLLSSGLLCTLIGLGLLELVLPAVPVLAAPPVAEKGDKPAPPPTPPIWSRLAKARCVVLGQVTTIEDKPIADVQEKKSYRIAVVKVNDVILGAKDQKEIKVGFLKEGELKAEQEACFILTPHVSQPFFLMQDPKYDLFSTQHKFFNLRTKILRHSAQCLEDPAARLKSQEARDRLLTASLLISRFRDPSAGASKTEAIDAELSKLLLRALRDADWGKEDKSYKLKPQPIFEMLGLTEKDGWKPSKDVRVDAENWLIDNHNKYRIQRFVPEKGK